ncbi:MAG: molybdopterin adenylyltransferase [Bacteroidetes bacterium]|jgi:molybdopterin adenylyltransferase|nr:molybdopterin adenylyltransferase [Bacteroidota bacterium]
MIKVGIITASDRGSRGEYDFLTGERVQEVLGKFFQEPLEYLQQVVPDEKDQLEMALLHMVDEEKCALVITAGGTGPAPRDVTPEATMAVCEKLLPGFGETMRRHGMQFVPTAFLSRQTAGIRHRSLIVNMPGNPRAVIQCMDAIGIGIVHTLVLLGHPKLTLSASAATPLPH